MSRRLLRGIARALFLFIAVAAFGQNAQFSAAYQTGTPTTQGNNVTVTVSTRVTNNGTADASNVTITLANLTAQNRDYGSFPTVTVFSAGGNVLLSQDFTVPKAVYDSWQNGGPVFSISYTLNGTSASQTIQATIVPQGQSL
jgi:hypothetical protein